MTLDSEDDTNSIKPTKFDIERLLAMRVGETVNHEVQNWRILRYSDSYILILENSSTESSFKEFFSLSELIEFLNK